MSQPLSEVAILLNPADNVAIARQIIPAGSLLVDEQQQFTANQDIPSGHKLARCAISAGQPVLRYGQVIGVASRDIQPGDWVHSHNLEVGNMAREFEQQDGLPLHLYSSDEEGDAKEQRLGEVGTSPIKTFLGFQRQDGRVGTRNYIAVIATVSCANQTARQIAGYFTPERLAAFPNVDGVIAIVHSTGCCAPSSSLAYRYLQRTLLHTANHPNVGGAIYVSLGCEGNQIQKDSMMLAANEVLAEYQNPIPIEAVLTIQDLGGIRATARAGVAAVEKLLVEVNAMPRTPQPLSELSLALQCGGSDGWSGVTANPLVGVVVDRLVDNGGTAILAETPEIFGAEHLLTRRAAQPQVARQLIDRIRDWQEQGAREGFTLDNNPSPGNKAGGLTTIYEKSLGAVAKGGSRPLQAVYTYAERVTQRGLVFMDTPGYDPVSVTGEVAGGANLVLFTTGRGSVFGGLIAPCIKIASNTATYQRMEEDMDFNAGVLLDGAGFDAAGSALLDLVIETASGKRSKSEATLERESEFIPWQPGGIL